MDIRKEYLSKMEKKDEKIKESGSYKLLGISAVAFFVNFMIQLILYGIRNKGIWKHFPYFISIIFILIFTLIYAADNSLIKLFILGSLFIAIVALDFFLNIYYTDGIKNSDTMLIIIYGFKIEEILNYILIIISIYFLKKIN